MINYTVASVHQTTVEREVTVGGMDVKAQVPALVVELVSADGGMGHTFTFVGAAAVDAAPIFELGASIVATFEKVS